MTITHGGVFCFNEMNILLQNEKTRIMLIIIIRCLIIFVFLIFGLRLMGKRTIGELQPIEFVIILAVADLACTPMQDISIPIIYGLVPLLTIFVTHYLITTVTSKSITFRKFLNGQPIIVIDKNGINSTHLKKLNLNVNDLLQMIRQEGYFSVEEIEYALIETNGKISILENEEAKSPSCVPENIVIEGKFIEDGAAAANISEKKVERILRSKNLRLKDVLLMTVESDKYFLQPTKDKFFTFFDGQEAQGEV